MQLPGAIALIHNSPTAIWKSLAGQGLPVRVPPMAPAISDEDAEIIPIR
jgi:hypothetical protein